MQLIQFAVDDPAAAVLRLRYAPDGQTLAVILGTPNHPQQIRWWDCGKRKGLLSHAATSGDHAPARGWCLPGLSTKLSRIVSHNTNDQGREWMTVIDVQKKANNPYPVLSYFSIRCLALSPDGRCLVAACENEYGLMRGSIWWDGAALATWDVGKPLTHTRRRQEWITPKTIDLPDDHVPVSTLEFSPDGRLLAAGATPGRAWIWASPFRKVDFNFAFHGGDGAVRRFQFSCNERFLGALNERAIEVWDLKARLSVFKAVAEKGEEFCDLDFSVHEQLLAVACGRGGVRTFSMPDGNEVGHFDWRIGRASAITFPPDGLTCAAGGEKGQVVVWDVDD